MAQCTSAGEMQLHVNSVKNPGLLAFQVHEQRPCDCRATRDDGVAHETGNLSAYHYDEMKYTSTMHHSWLEKRTIKRCVS